MKYFLLFAIISLSGLTKSSAQTPAQTVPKFTFFKPDHSSFTNANLAQNKMLFFFFFDPECEHCQQAANNLNNEYKSYKNTAVYLVSVASIEKINAFIVHYLPAFPKAQNATVLQDSNNEFITRFQPIRYPSMFLFSTEKKLVDYEDNAESMFRFLKPIQAFAK